MYRKILLASVGAIALTGSAAFAADLPSRAPPPVYLPPPPIFTWTGIYIGVQIGGAWGSGGSHFNAFDPDTDTFVDRSFGGTPSGVIGGGHVGFNYQIPALELVFVVRRSHRSRRNGRRDQPKQVHCGHLPW